MTWLVPWLYLWHSEWITCFILFVYNGLLLLASIERKWYTSILLKSRGVSDRKCLEILQSILFEGLITYLMDNLYLPQSL